MDRNSLMEEAKKPEDEEDEDEEEPSPDYHKYNLWIRSVYAYVGLPYPPT